MTLTIKAIADFFGYGSPVPKVVMCLSALVLMTFSSCSDSDDDPASQPEPADMVRLVSHTNETISGPLTVTSQLSNVWENGRLIRQTQTITSMGISTEVVEIFTYNERGLCTEMYDRDGHFHHYYSYTPDGRIAKDVHIIDGDTAAVTEVLAYDSDGNVAETRYHVPASSITRKSRLTWQDGDLVKATTEYVSEDRETDTYTFTYDNYPSAYTGYPVAIGISNVTFMALHCSKHNEIDSGFTPSYENGRLVSLVKDDGTDNTYFTYDDGTGQRK